jgi:rifampicin phosphotransferase
MEFIKDTQFDLAHIKEVGGKASNLFRLKSIGIEVPSWIVIPNEALAKIIPDEIKSQSHKQIINFIQNIEIPSSTIQSISDYFKDVKFLAVRSSALDEDGSDFSFAGQFESYLFVTPLDLAEHIKKVWCSGFSERVFQYKMNNGLQLSFGIAVIVQEMINADQAGVAFGMNPTNGDRKSKIISAVLGLGEGLVSGELDADNYWMKDGLITRQIVSKSQKVVFNEENLSGTKVVSLNEDEGLLPALSDQQVFQICSVLDLAFKEYGKPQDMEFAFSQGKLFLLQSRPITNLHKIPDTSGNYILWDNSNIVESYPGVTTPLTFSFISKSYESAYRLFCEYLGVSQTVLQQNKNVFANTLGLINGRVYYNLKSWYQMLALLPGYSINARFMEKMMGVKERFDIPEKLIMSKGKAWWSIFKLILKMYFRFINLPRKRSEFMVLLNRTIAQYKAIDFNQSNAVELMNHYLEFERVLLNEWKAPLLNDFFAMVWFGMLQKRCVQYGLDSNPNIHNDLLCGSSDIISTQPIHRTISIAAMVAGNSFLTNVFSSSEPKKIWKIIQDSNDAEVLKIKSEIERYILDFGERCIGELKLETVSYTQDPVKFIHILKSYVDSKMVVENTTGRVEIEIRSKAEELVQRKLKYNFLKKWILKRTIKRARELVSSRENLRYERTRAFGIVREIFSQMGRNFYAEGIIIDSRDIFYLTKEEIFAFIEGTSVNHSLKDLISLRKSEFTQFEKNEIPAERFATYGSVYHANDFFNQSRVEKVVGDIKGIGCCPGIVRAKVRVVMNPGEVASLNGDILVTSSTDPGWVTLFPSASGIIVERGSLLSHSAIVSREMGKPCIVSVTGLLKRLKTGDEIEMDGGTGEVRIINQD